MMQDIEYIQVSLSKSPMMNRIRFLITDRDFTHPELKGNNVYLIMYSCLQMV